MLYILNSYWINFHILAANNAYDTSYGNYSVYGYIGIHMMT